jgi:hypothetical protein
VGKEVYRREKLSLPDFSKTHEATGELFTTVRKIKFLDLDEYTFVQLGRSFLLVVEVAGLFTIGEIIGRRNFIGYKH